MFAFGYFSLKDFVRYDVSGVPIDRLARTIQLDWAHLMYDRRILDSPSYLREHGRAVICLRGSHPTIPSLNYNLTNPF